MRKIHDIIWYTKAKNLCRHPRAFFKSLIRSCFMTPLHCQSEISGFAMGNFYLKDSPSSHTFHIILNGNRNVYLYAKAILKDLSLNFLYDIIFQSLLVYFVMTNFLSNDCFLQIIFSNHKLRSRSTLFFISN